MKFASISNLTSIVGLAYAASGIGSAMSAALCMESQHSSSATCSGSYIAGMPSQLNTALAQSLIIATYNAMNLGSCITSYGVLISYYAPTSLPVMPYLIYAQSSGVVWELPTGMHVLLYGPGMDTLNIEGLRNAVTNVIFSVPALSPTWPTRT